MSATVRVFISSTAEDLREYRDEVSQAIERLDSLGVRMEAFGARPRQPVPACIEQVTRCDILVVIVAHRYGWVPSTQQGGDGRRSITWIEVQAAIDAGKPILAFLVDPSFAWTQSKEQDQLVSADSDSEAVEVHRRVRLLKEFKAFLSSGLTRDSFTTPKDLSAKVAASLGAWLLSHQREIYAPDQASEIKQYLQDLASFRGSEDWVPRAIPLRVREANGHEDDALASLRAWVNAGHPSALFVVGDFGSGKTELIYRLAAELAQERLTRGTGQIPLVASLRRARRAVPSTPDDLLALTEPTATKALLEIRRESPEFILILDGLDELLDPTDPAPTRYREVVQSLYGLMPKGTRLLLTCRDVAFEPISAEVKAGLAQERDSSSTDQAINRAMGISCQDSLVLSLCPLTPDQCSRFLAPTPAGAIWTRVRGQPGYSALVRSPFTVRLLERALPRLGTTSEAPDLAELYRIALEAWLFRDHTSSLEEVRGLLKLLEDVVCGAFMERANPAERSAFLQSGLVRQSGSQAHGSDLGRLTRCGLLIASSDGRIKFCHYSFVEYFVARRLDRDLAIYEARTLARLNLIGAYNINRLLIPMIWTRLAKQRATSCAKSGSNHDALAQTARLITRREYREFVRSTGWRERVGHGIHPSFVASDGTSFISGGPGTSLEPEAPIDSEFGDDTEPVTNVSWYDAVEYAQWSGATLPGVAHDELVRRECGARALLFVWGGEWADEARAHMLAHSIQRTDLPDRVGINPDYRNHTIGLCVID